MSVLRYTREQLAEAVRESWTMAEVLRKVGLVASGGNYETVRARIQEWGIDASHLRHRRRVRWPDDQAVAIAVASSRSLMQAMKSLGIRPSGSGYAGLRDVIRRLELDISHMTGRG